ncbi:MAG: hypothetical protein M3N52_00735 [Actinomycetota bacterium]|nr:hypothetical protein [Actinomycetota bacterium]
MMWMTMRGSRAQGSGLQEDEAAAREVTRLRAEVDQLREGRGVREHAEGRWTGVEQ